MAYVEGSERWPSQLEQASILDALVTYDRQCNVCGRCAPSTIGDVAFDSFDDLDDDVLQA